MFSTFNQQRLMRSNNGRIKQKSLILFNAVYIVFILCVINLKQHSFLLVTGYTVDREPNIIESYKRKIYFAGETPVTGTELFVSDGTYSGTSIFADISNGTISSFPKYLVVYDNILYFSADNGAVGRELWRTDGTNGGTFMVKDICTGPGSSDPSNFTIFKDRLYFAADDCEHGRELWHLYQNGTKLEVKMYKDVQPGLASSNPHNFGVLVKEGDGTTTNPRIEFKMYFAANTTLHIYPNKTWTSTTSAPSGDGDGTGRRRLEESDNATTTTTTNSATTTNAPNNTYVSTTSDASNSNLTTTTPPEDIPDEVSNLTTTSPPENIPGEVPMPPDNSIMEFEDSDSLEYNISHLGVELWETTGEDGVESATSLALDINEGSEGSEPSEMVWYYDKLYFAAYRNGAGSQLWRVHMHRDHIFLATQNTPCCHKIETVVAGVSRACPGPPFVEYDELTGYPSGSCAYLEELIDSGTKSYSSTSDDFIIEMVTRIGPPPEGANAFMLTILEDVLYFGTQYEDDTKLYEVQRKVAPFEAASGVMTADDVVARVIESEDEFGFEIVDAILGGVYNRYQGHRNTENKPIIKWHGYSSYPINYQKVWLNKLAMGEQLDP